MTTTIFNTNVRNERMAPKNGESIVSTSVNAGRTQETAARDRKIVGNANVNDNKIETYLIRFHFKSGKSRDMLIDKEDASGNPNEFEHAVKIFHSVSNTMRHYGTYTSKNYDIVSQNFIVTCSEVEFMELLEAE